LKQAISISGNSKNGCVANKDNCHVLLPFIDMLTSPQTGVLSELY
jgi:hypothetical protein